jgi:hypothetical protein
VPATIEDASVIEDLRAALRGHQSGPAAGGGAVKPDTAQTTSGL